MKIYCASLNFETLLRFNKICPGRRLNVLRSFALLSPYECLLHNAHRGKIGSMILDSGTFSLNYAAGINPAQVCLNGYLRYLKLFGGRFDWYANFDADFNENGFENNLGSQQALEAEGLSPVPVVHDIYGDEIPYYIQKGYRRVALGSPQITNEDALAMALSKFAGTDIKIHLMGNVRFKYLANFPIHSADTAGWARTGGFGLIRYWNPEKKGINKTDRIYLQERIKGGPVGNTVYSTYQYRSELDKFLWKTFNLTYYDLIGPTGQANKQLVNTYYYAQLEDIITDIHRQKGFKT